MNTIIPLHIQKILNKRSSEVSPEHSKSNCFWATKYFFESSALPPQHLSGNEILQFVAKNFIQVQKPQENDIFIIWSSNNPSLSPDRIDTHYLSTYPDGFPFGLIVEHSGVFLKGDKIFHKASPKENDLFEIVTQDLSFLPYKNLLWVRVTFHRKKSYSV